MDGEELLAIASRLEGLHDGFERDHAPALRRLIEVAGEVGRSWSGSNIGYHACVYYRDFQLPSPGEHFSVEWGLHNPFRDTAPSHWRECRSDDVKAEVDRRAGDPDLSIARAVSIQIAGHVGDARAAIVSALTLVLQEGDDTYLRALMEKADKAVPRSTATFGDALMPRGTLSSRDQIALGQGRQISPHQQTIAATCNLIDPSTCAKNLAVIARQAGSHIARRGQQRRRNSLVGTNVFIGHGRSAAWRDLKDFVRDRLDLPYDEFNRVPVAGITNSARLSEMLDASAVAFLILTAEDERADGLVQARMNVIHEVGLFQGRLGFTKAIVLLEEDCAEFTNIQGLGQIRFPAGNIAAAFEEIRRVLEREGLIDA